MATTYTEYLQIPKHSPTDPFNIALINEGFDKTEAGILEAYRGRAAYNLLRNSHFEDVAKIVNQRRQTSYTSSIDYTIDGWKMDGSKAATVTVNEDKGITLTSTSGSGYVIWMQRLEKLPAGKYTLAVKTSNGLYVKAYDISAAQDYEGLSIDNSWFANVNTAGAYPAVRIYYTGSDVKSAVLYWIKFYPGTYTAETLPDDIPEKYSTSLAENQLDYRTIMASSASLSVAIGLAVGGMLYCPMYIGPMMEVPTVTYAEAAVTNEAVSDANVTGMYIFSYDKTSGFATLAVSTSATLTNGSFYRLAIKAGGSINFSAER